MTINFFNLFIQQQYTTYYVATNVQLINVIGITTRGAPGDADKSKLKKTHNLTHAHGWKKASAPRNNRDKRSVLNACVSKPHPQPHIPARFSDKNKNPEIEM